MMANYTMEIREMMNNPLVRGVFTFTYDFYGDEQEKAEFEKLFIQYYYLSEIGFETPERFKLKLQAKLNIIMPYYKQLAMTEWNKLRTIEQMMTSKNLIESTTHEQTITGDNETTTTGNSTAKTTNDNSSSLNSDVSLTLNNETSSELTNETTNTQSSTSEVESTDTQNGKTSSLSDGVSQVSLDNGYLTTVNQTNGTSNQSTTQTGNQTSNQTGNQTSTQSQTQTTKQTDNQTLSGSSNSLSDMNQTTKGNNEQTLRETTIFSSTGDIGIQTPAYAITEWRKVLININQMIIDECHDLFMKIY